MQPIIKSLHEIKDKNVTFKNYSHVRTLLLKLGNKQLKEKNKVKITDEELEDIIKSWIEGIVVFTEKPTEENKKNCTEEYFNKMKKNYDEKINNLSKCSNKLLEVLKK